ncbi:MAG: pyridoxine 5'-phosphate synthase [Proteobacteria bacterium]|jgi:pyridoxine 5-phosphate synthase|nr:pyridoxine 5'-phosphate synthase [Pseudomonadota bacterium]
MHRTLLSINVNKYALLRNARGHDAPNLLTSIDMCLAAGAHGITVHPRMDQRHTRFDDVPLIAEYLGKNYPHIEFNVECEDHPALIDLVLQTKPHQCTLVPVTPGEVTSDHGFNLPQQSDSLHPTVKRLKNAGIRVSLFADCEPENIHLFAEVGADRVELYTGPYAWAWGTANETTERDRLWRTAEAAAEAGLGLNAGHDLDRHNLSGVRGLTNLLEVSIGHAHVCRALEVGTDQSVRELLAALGWQ